MIDVPDQKQIIAHYGCHNQVLVAIEELSELTKALTKFNRKDTNTTSTELNSIIEEISDVYIVLDQLKDIFGFDDREIQLIVYAKTARTIENLK